MQVEHRASERLVGEHLAAASLYLLAGAAGLVWIAPALAHGLYLQPHVAGVTHLFTLGWLTLTIFGALAQLLPMALGAPIRSVRLAHVAFWLLAPGIGLFACGVATLAMPLMVPGVLLVASGILLAVGNVAATLPRGRTHDVTWAGIALGITFLTSTLAFGLVLTHNLHTGFVAAARMRILTAHLHLALVGWVLIVVVGVSRRLLPMFMVAHSANARWSPRALTLLALGVPALAVGLVTRSTIVSWTGAVLVDAGVVAFLWQTVMFYRARTRPLDDGMRFVRASLPFLTACGILGPTLLALGPAHARLATVYLITGLLGFLVPFVTGLLYEIVPTLAWTTRYGGRLNRGRVPAVADLYSARVARWQLAMYMAGVLLLVAGVASTSAAVARSGALLFLVGVLLFVTQIARMRWGAPAAPHPPAGTSA
ncbi:MAG: hypothetical protein ACRENQ_10965 [Gemmatimonadaceae bacterium]